MSTSSQGKRDSEYSEPESSDIVEKVFKYGTRKHAQRKSLNDLIEPQCEFSIKDELARYVLVIPRCTIKFHFFKYHPVDVFFLCCK